MWSDLKFPPINLWTAPYLEIKAAKYRAGYAIKNIVYENERLLNFKKLLNDRASK